MNLHFYQWDNVHLTDKVILGFILLEIYEAETGNKCQTMGRRSYYPENNSNIHQNITFEL